MPDFLKRKRSGGKPRDKILCDILIVKPSYRYIPARPQPFFIQMTVNLEGGSGEKENVCEKKVYIPCSFVERDSVQQI